tara:strand:+ start:1580 stop:2071 length:492 start_codon:yes stop_codon:yes gene_type:complete
MDEKGYEKEKKRIYIPTTEEILLIHDSLIRAHGGLGGVREIPSYVPAICDERSEDWGLIPTMGFMLSRLSKGHYFVDGNKRTAYFTTRYGLLRNGCDINGVSPEEAVEQLEKIVELPDAESKKFAENVVREEIVENQPYLDNLDQYTRLVLKSIAVSNKLSNR